MFAPPKSTPASKLKPVVAKVVNGAAKKTTLGSFSSSATSATSSSSSSASSSSSSSSSSTSSASNRTLTKTSRTNIRQPVASGASNKAPSQPADSLLGAAKSTSRSSLLSDTTASVCSFSSSRSAPRQHLPHQQRPSSSTLINNALTRRSSSLLSSASTGQPQQQQQPSSGLIKTTKTSGQLTVSSLSKQRPPASSVSQQSITSTTATSGQQKNRVPTLAMSLRDKDQQIKLLIKERDEQKSRAELLAKKVDEWREKFEASELERSHVTSEADDEVVELRRLAQEFEDENKRLAELVQRRDSLVSDTQFKLDELECERQQMRKELEDKEDQLKQMELEREQLNEGTANQGTLITERVQSKAKYEREIEELKERVLAKEEQMIQLRSSLEMRKNEVLNLQSHSGDLERKLKIESERSERHLKRIDEINLELKACEAKLSTKLEENDVLDKQVRQLRQELRSAEERLEQISLARKKDVDILHNKLSAARRGSTTPTSPQPYKTPTPQDEIVRLQMEIRDLKDQLIDREAELDCNRRDLEVMRRKMETRTLEVDCNNQELARRCQDLLEQNRQSEDTIKQLLKSTTEHSAQLMRATEDLKEANGKCVKLRDQVNELETKLEEQLEKSNNLLRENNQLKERHDDQEDQIDLLRQQVESLNEQLGELCQQLNAQQNQLHKDREQMADQLSSQDIDLAQLRHDLAGAKQDLRTSKLQTQEVSSERDRLKADLEIKEKYVRSRNDIIETMRHELDDTRKSLAECKSKLESLRETSEEELSAQSKELKSQIESIRRELQAKCEECNLLRQECIQLQSKLRDLVDRSELESDEKFDEMRRKHSEQLDQLKLKLKTMEGQLSEANNNNNLIDQNHSQQQVKEEETSMSKEKRDEYETQIEFLNSLVVDMQKKCDDYKNRLAQINVMNDFDNLFVSSLPARHNNNSHGVQPAKSVIANGGGLANNRAATLSRPPRHQQQQPPCMSSDFATLTRPRGIVRVQDPLSKGSSGEQVDAGDTTPTNLGGPQHQHPEQARHQKQQPARRISGRPFCDICQVYDLHHTIYCNKQQADDSNNNSLEAGAQAKSSHYVDELFREYEQSLEEEINRSQFSSLRRPQAKQATAAAAAAATTNSNLSQAGATLMRPYCDHCDLFGHTVKSCHSLKA